uniref:Uncharacterized protein n=1 Tax=Plectus sambesii TaxID=2011161 RepID=A0A914X5Q3_9BILA
MTRSKAKAEEANKSVAKRKSSSRPSVEEKQFSAKRVKDEKSSHVAPTATAVVISGAQIGNSPASGRGRRGSTDNADDGPLHEHYAFYESFRNGRLQEFRNLDDKTRSRIVRQAIQQSPHGVLNCLNSPDCTKSCKSALGAKYHLERCGNQNEQPTTSNTPDAENQSTYLQYKNKLDEWKALSMEERNKIMRKGLLAGPMPCLRATECSSTFTSFSGLRYHLEHCEKPGKVRAPGSGTALTPSDKERLGVLYDSYKGKMPEWRQLDAKERTRIVRAAMAARGALHCLGEDCDTQSSHAYGLGYHLDRCGLTDQ